MTLALDRKILGTPLARWLLAAAGLGFFAVAVAGALTGSPLAGRCLDPGAAAPVAGLHCGWCWAAIAALAAAALPWPRARGARA
jgi:hypothetical protein